MIISDCDVVLKDLYLMNSNGCGRMPLRQLDYGQFQMVEVQSDCAIHIFVATGIQIVQNQIGMGQVFAEEPSWMQKRVTK